MKYKKHMCKVCGAVISQNGAATDAHWRKHLRGDESQRTPRVKASCFSTDPADLDRCLRPDLRPNTD